MPETTPLVIGACQPKAGVHAIVAEPGGKSYRVQCDDRHRLPAVVIKQGSPPWGLDRFVYLAVDLTNPGTEEILVEFRVNEIAGMTSGGAQVIPPGATATIRAFVIRDEFPPYLEKALFGMFALPGHPSVIRYWQGLHPGTIDRFALVAVHPPKGAAFVVSNLRGEGAYRFLSEAELARGFFPMVDEFGQYRHRDWPGKIHALDELKHADAAEQRDLAANPAPAEWNQYGGWRQGPQLPATGHFRTQKIDGRWWLVDPE